MPRPILATISLPALNHNLNSVAGQLKQAGTSLGRPAPYLWAVIKADAYGHGIANALQGFKEADGLAMLDLNEAVRCREAGWTKPILLLEGFFEVSDVAVLDNYRLATTLHTQEQLDMLEAAAPAKPLDAFVKFNSGMNRLGFSEARYRDAYRQSLQMQQRGIVGRLGKMTHLACADDDALLTREHLRFFKDVTRDLPGAVSVCNSAATLTPGFWPEVSDTAEQWVRPGICLYGASPFANRPAAELGLRPAMTLSTRLIAIQDISAGAGVGYGRTFIAPQSMRTGVVACGYADGYPRHAPTGTPVSVHGALARLLGRVSMDMLSVDLTGIPQARVGSPVVLWGQGGPSVDDVAHAAGTIGYELLCAVAPRVRKQVI